MTDELEVVEVPPGWIASVRRRVAWAELGRVVPEALGEVWRWLTPLRDRVEVGHNVVVYHQPGPDDVELECGVQIGAPVEGAPAPIRCARAPLGRAARMIHRGPYTELGRTHDALAKACRERGYPAAVHWEVYRDPVEDPAALETEVYTSIEANAAQIAYWNGPAGDRWATTWQVLDRCEVEITEALLALAAPRAGERVLDVGCGAGSTTLKLRERVGAAGAVTGLDISAPMLAAARARAADGGVAFIEADAATHAFRPEFDLVFSRFGVMFFLEPEPAFANLRRAAAAGGRLSFVCWRTVDDNPWVTVALGAVRDLLLKAVPPPADTPGPFGLADPDRMRGILERAGWRELAIERREHAMWLGETVPEAARLSMQVGLLARFLGELDEGGRRAVHERLVVALAPFEGPGGVALPASSWLVSARA